jgi:hypothetical protein
VIVAAQEELGQQALSQSLLASGLGFNVVSPNPRPLNFSNQPFLQIPQSTPKLSPGNGSAFSEIAKTNTPKLSPIPAFEPKSALMNSNDLLNSGFGNLNPETKELKKGNRFICDVCSYSCLHLSKLKTHKRVHTGEKV